MWREGLLIESEAYVEGVMIHYHQARFHILVESSLFGDQMPYFNWNLIKILERSIELDVNRPSPNRRPSR